MRSRACRQPTRSPRVPRRLVGVYRGAASTSLGRGRRQTPGLRWSCTRAPIASRPVRPECPDAWSGCIEGPQVRPGAGPTPDTRTTLIMHSRVYRQPTRSPPSAPTLRRGVSRGCKYVLGRGRRQTPGLRWSCARAPVASRPVRPECPDASSGCIEGLQVRPGAGPTPDTGTTLVMHSRACRQPTRSPRVPRRLVGVYRGAASTSWGGADARHRDYAGHALARLSPADPFAPSAPTLGRGVSRGRKYVLGRGRRQTPGLRWSCTRAPVASQSSQSPNHMNHSSDVPYSYPSEPLDAAVHLCYSGRRWNRCERPCVLPPLHRLERTCPALDTGTCPVLDTGASPILDTGASPVLDTGTEERVSLAQRLLYE